ncbi:MAG: SprA-related family protein [Desulfobacteraceae bacterium]|nr:SprA-related family protein [Desulfobacteraceae bacterium]
MNINAIQNSYAYSIWQQDTKQSSIVPNTQQGIKTNLAEDIKPEIKPADSQLIENRPTGNQKTTDKTKNPENQDTGSIKKEASSKIAEELDGELTRAEKMVVTELKQIDQAVRKHEMAHVAAGGRYILSSANYSYKNGPDGKRYIVGGEVTIDTAPIPGDPQATINKMQQVRRAALAPVDPSPQDRRVASTAMTISTKAMSELMVTRSKDKIDSDEEKAFGNIKSSADKAYAKVQNMPESQQEPSFRISA